MSRPTSETLSAPVELLADGPEAGDEPKRFSLVAYTGAVVRRLYGDAVFDLTGMEAPETLAILLEHDSRSVVGHADLVEVTPDGVRMSGNVYEDEEAGQTVRRRSLKGFPWKASIGVEVMRWQSLDEGEEAEVNGQTLAGPLSIARESRLFETSFVVIPADKGTSGETMKKQEGEEMSADTLTQATAEQLSAATAEGNKQGRADARAELAEFLTAFEGREGWAALRFAAGDSKTKAKAALSDVLLVELAAKATADKAEASDAATLAALEAEAGVSFDASARQEGQAAELAAADPLEGLSDEEKAERLWAESESLRREFGRQKSAFLTLVRHEGLDSFTPQEG